MDAERARAARNKQSKVVAPAEDLVSFPDPQDKRGYLFKKGRGRKTFVRPWTQRLFELSVADLKIRYYAESADSELGELRGELDLDGASVRAVSQAEAGRPYCFEVRPKNVQEDGCLLCSALSAREATSWIEHISLALRRDEIRRAKMEHARKNKEQAHKQRLEKDAAEAKRIIQEAVSSPATAPAIASEQFEAVAPPPPGPPPPEEPAPRAAPRAPAAAPAPAPAPAPGQQGDIADLLLQNAVAMATAEKVGIIFATEDASEKLVVESDLGIIESEMRRVRQETTRRIQEQQQQQKLAEEERLRQEQERAEETRHKLIELRKEQRQRFIETARSDADALLSTKKVMPGSKTIVTRDQFIKRSDVVKEIFESGENSEAANTIQAALAKKKAEMMQRQQQRTLQEQLQQRTVVTSPRSQSIDMPPPPPPPMEDEDPDAPLAHPDDDEAPDIDGWL